MQSASPGNRPRTHVSVTRPQAVLDVVLALILTLVAGLVAAITGPLLATRFGLPLLMVVVIQGLIIVLGLQLLLAWRRQAWYRLGLRAPRVQDLGLALVALLLVFALNLVMTLVALQFVPDMVATHQTRLAEFGTLLTGDLPLLTVGAAMLFTGFYEEAMARGFLLNRCQNLMSGTWGPVLLSSILFGLGHFYQGWFGVVQTALVGIVLARLALRWGTLWPLIIAHAALNTISFAVFRYGAA